MSASNNAVIWSDYRRPEQPGWLKQVDSSGVGRKLLQWISRRCGGGHESARCWASHQGVDLAGRGESGQDVE